MEYTSEQLPAIAALIILALFSLSSFTLYRLWRERRTRVALETRFSGIFDVDAEINRLEKQANDQKIEIEILRSDYREKRMIYDQLIKEVAIFDEKLAFSEMGVYEPHFDFSDSEAYKAAIGNIRELQKQLISKGGAVICTIEWSVDGSKSKGKTMTARNIRLALRAFNNECDAAIANARWNNVNAMEKRIIHAQEQIDKLNASNKIYITQEYLRSKLQELYVTHEYREKLKEEREERAEAARLAREEQKLLHDMEKACEEEEHYEKLLAKARSEAAKIAGPQLEAFTQQIKTLESDLAEAHARFARAQAMAEKTRSGYVYIISNIGSFGSDVIKIGLTRRLDPVDRVRELGDASVPFAFDTHAIIYSEDAPALERALHNEFEEVRVNARNYRKEFFRASLDDVEKAVKRLSPDASFFRDIEAQEYHETIARRQNELERAATQERVKFPETI
ncbi:MAG TPA: DUF4041 domain-containing protein [Planctomycetaceae bacterium]|nr:DUF4041 domain-containing protein [Planctomycetaceae bacterium]